MDRLARHLLSHAYNNAWANYRLLTACGQLTQADFVAPRISFFPSIKATLNHTLTVDWFYIDAMQRSLAGDGPNPKARSFFEPAEPFDTCLALAAEQRRSDAGLIALCKRLDAASLASNIAVPRSTGVADNRLDRLLAHLFEHQTHHRGQVHAMLSGTNVKPPQLDEFFCVDDAPLHAADFDALGFSEAEIWPAEE